MAAKAPVSHTLRNTDVREWKIPGFDEPFVQDPLTFFEKNEFLGIVARALEDALSGGADIDSVLMLLGMNEEQFKQLLSGGYSSDLTVMASSLFNVLTRVISSAPTLLEDVYMLALSVDPTKRGSVREGLRQIDDDTGFGIMETFVDQNATTIRDFFPRWRGLLDSMSKSLQQTGATSPTSTD